MNGNFYDKFMIDSLITVDKEDVLIHNMRMPLLKAMIKHIYKPLLHVKINTYHKWSEGDKSDDIKINITPLVLLVSLCLLIIFPNVYSHILILIGCTCLIYINTHYFITTVVDKVADDSLFISNDFSNPHSIGDVTIY